MTLRDDKGHVVYLVEVASDTMWPNNVHLKHQLTTETSLSFYLFLPPVTPTPTHTTA